MYFHTHVYIHLYEPVGTLPTSKGDWYAGQPADHPIDPNKHACERTFHSKHAFVADALHTCLRASP